MILRKINAVFSLICTILVLGHAISLAVWMLSQGAALRAPSILSRALTVAVAIHAILCIVLMIIAHKGGKKIKGNQYPELNSATIFQRFSGILIIVFSVLHILGAAGITETPQVVHAIVPPLFFTLILAHTAVSTVRAFIALGIGNARFIKCADVVIKTICVATLLADIIGFYLFVC